MALKYAKDALVAAAWLPLNADGTHDTGGSLHVDCGLSVIEETRSVRTKAARGSEDSCNAYVPEKTMFGSTSLVYTGCNVWDIDLLTRLGIEKAVDDGGAPATLIGFEDPDSQDICEGLLSTAGHSEALVLVHTAKCSGEDKAHPNATHIVTYYKSVSVRPAEETISKSRADMTGGRVFNVDTKINGAFVDPYGIAPTSNKVYYEQPVDLIATDQIYLDIIEPACNSCGCV